MRASTQRQLLRPIQAPPHNANEATSATYNPPNIASTSLSPTGLPRVYEIYAHPEPKHRWRASCLCCGADNAPLIATPNSTRPAHTPPLLSLPCIAPPRPPTAAPPLAFFQRPRPALPCQRRRRRGHFCHRPAAPPTFFPCKQKPPRTNAFANLPFPAMILGPVDTVRLPCFPMSAASG